MNNNTRGVKRTLRVVNAPTAKRMMTKRFRNKVNSQVLKESARYGVTNLNATSLDLSDRRLTKIPDFVFHMKNLKELLFDDNKLKTLPKEIGRLKNLQRLQISHNFDLTSLPSEIGQLKNLRFMNLSSCNINTLPPTIGQLKKLESLNLHDNKLSSLPAEICELKKLKSLDLNDNKLTSLPAEIGKLKNLQELYISMAKLITLPESFKNLSDDIVILYGATNNNYTTYTKQEFMKKYGPKRINKNTELLNRTFLPTNNIPRGKRVYLNIPSNVKNNGTLRRVYNKNAINQFIRGREGEPARLHGNNFTEYNIRNMNNKNFNLQRIRVRLLNTSLNNMKTTIEGLKNRLPPNVSRTDVNNVVQKIKPLLLNKIRNKLRTTPENNRRALINRYRRDGLINNRDVL